MMTETLDFVFFDYSKAFDKVCHGVLLRKLYEIDIHGSTSCWTHGFLSSRTMRVGRLE